MRRSDVAFCAGGAERRASPRHRSRQVFRRAGCQSAQDAYEIVGYYVGGHSAGWLVDGTRVRPTTRYLGTSRRVRGCKGRGDGSAALVGRLVPTPTSPHPPARQITTLEAWNLR